MTTNAGSSKSMRLRYAGRCRVCGLELPAGTAAVYERETRTVRCASCGDEAAAASDGVSGRQETEIDRGIAGGSARREFERRRDAREKRIRDAHPKLGGLILAVSDEPQTTRSWEIGDEGEKRLGARLDGLENAFTHVLHDRRIPRTGANIDHIVICPSGVFVIDAKKYKGRPTLKVEGGFFRPRTEKLLVGSRDCTRLVDGVKKHVGRVTTALQSARLGDVPVMGMLCFVGADWPLFGGDFTVDDVRVLWPRKAADHIGRTGSIDASTSDALLHALGAAFPAYV